MQYKLKYTITVQMYGLIQEVLLTLAKRRHICKLNYKTST